MMREDGRFQAAQRIIRKVAHLRIAATEHMHNGTCVINKYSRSKFAKHKNRR